MISLLVTSINRQIIKNTFFQPCPLCRDWVTVLSANRFRRRRSQLRKRRPLSLVTTRLVPTIGSTLMTWQPEETFRTRNRSVSFFAPPLFQSYAFVTFRARGRFHKAKMPKFVLQNAKIFLVFSFFKFKKALTPKRATKVLKFCNLFFNICSKILFLAFLRG